MSNDRVYTVTLQHLALNYDFQFRKMLLGQPAFTGMNFVPVSMDPSQRYQSAIVNNEGALLRLLRYLAHSGGIRDGLDIYFSSGLSVSNTFLDTHSELIQDAGKRLGSQSSYLKYNKNLLDIMATLFQENTSDRAVVSCLVDRGDDLLIVRILELLRRTGKRLSLKILYKRPFRKEEEAFFVNLAAQVRSIDFGRYAFSLGSELKGHDLSFMNKTATSVQDLSCLGDVLFLRKLMVTFRQENKLKHTSKVTFRSDLQTAPSSRVFTTGVRLLPIFALHPLTALNLNITLRGVRLSGNAVDRCLVALLLHIDKGNVSSLYVSFWMECADPVSLTRRMWLYKEVIMRTFTHRSYSSNGKIRFNVNNSNERYWAILFSQEHLLSFVSRMLVESGELVLTALRNMRKVMHTLGDEADRNYSITASKYLVPDSMATDIKLRDKKRKIK